MSQSAGAVEYTSCIFSEELDSLNECPGYETKQSDLEAPVMLEHWEMPSRHFLSLIPGPFWPGVVTPDRVLSMGQRELNWVRFWIVWTRSVLTFDGNYTRMLRAILNKFWRQHPTKHQLYGHLLPITKTIQVRRTRHAGHCWRSRDELISDVLIWTPTYSLAKAGRPARTYIQQLREDTRCSPEDLPEAMNNREKWRERVKDISASGPTIWWL